MPWFKVDDNLPYHAKVVAAGNTAMGLWVRAGAWSAQQLTDGYVPAHMIASLGGNRTHARKLVDVGLWHATDEGYRFHQWDQRQPMREKVEADRAEAVERMRKAREAKRSGEVRPNTDDRSGEVRNALVAVTPTRPDPTRPVSVLAERDDVDVCDDEPPPTPEELEQVAATLRSVPWVPDDFGREQAS